MPFFHTLSYDGDMFGRSRRRDETLERLERAVTRLAESNHAPPVQGPGGDRLEALELRVDSLEQELVKQLAQAEAITTKAKSRFEAARAAEERARRYAEQAELSLGESDEGEDQEDLDAIRAAYAEAGVPFDDGDGSEESGVHPVRAGMAPGSRSHAARAAKWGRA